MKGGGGERLKSVCASIANTQLTFDGGFPGGGDPPVLGGPPFGGPPDGFLPCRFGGGEGGKKTSEGDSEQQYVCVSGVASVSACFMRRRSTHTHTHTHLWRASRRFTSWGLARGRLAVLHEGERERRGVCTYERVVSARVNVRVVIDHFVVHICGIERTFFSAPLGGFPGGGDPAGGEFPLGGCVSFNERVRGRERGGGERK